MGLGESSAADAGLMGTLYDLSESLSFIVIKLWSAGVSSVIVMGCAAFLAVRTLLITSPAAETTATITSEMITGASSPAIGEGPFVFEGVFFNDFGVLFAVLLSGQGLPNT